MLIIAAFNQWSTVVNYIMAEFTKIMACGISFSKCWSNLVSLYQAAALFISYFILLHEFLYYEHKTSPNKEHRTHLMYYFGFLGYALATIPSAIVPGV